MAGRGDKKPPPGKAGYESDFVNSPKEVQSECPICLLILRDPHLTSCCGHNFCAACIGRIEKDGKPCPLCNAPCFSTMANKDLKRTLNEFHVHCANRLQGCDWIGELGKLDEHLNYEPQPELQLEGCRFAVVECIQCKEGIRRDKVSGHQLEQCPQRPYTCEYCAEYKSTFEDVTHNHWAECKCFLLPCPNNCTPSGPGIKRQDLDHHVTEECPLTVVQCELHHAGCKVSLPRKDMADHTREDSVIHISLLAAENLRLQAQVTSQSKELEQSKAKVSSQSQELAKVRTELHEAQQQTIERLQAQVTSQSKESKAELVKIRTEVQEVQQQSTERLQAQQQATERLQTQQEHDLQELRTHVANIVPVTIKMAGFEELKKKDTKWYSSPFYTGIGGYKMCLEVAANGNGDGKDTHVSVFTHLMHGEFDSQLKWPFRGTFTIQLVNQLEDKKHCTRTWCYNDATPADGGGQMTDEERSRGWGKPQFIPHTNLNHTKNRQYLKDDCLVFHVLFTK